MNINFTVFDNETGKVKRVGECPENMWEIQANESEYVIKGVVVDKYLQKIDTTTLEIIDRPAEDFIDEAIKENQRKDIIEHEQIIQNKMNEILRRMAIEELKK